MERGRCSLSFFYPKDKAMNKKVLNKMLEKGFITNEEAKSPLKVGLYTMYIAGVELLNGVERTLAAQKEAYNKNLEGPEDLAKEALKQLKRINKAEAKAEAYKKEKGAQMGLPFEKPKRKRAKTQREEVIRHLEEEGQITSLEAFREYGITRLSAIIYKLRDEGMGIKTETVTAKNRYGNKVAFAKYFVEKS